MKAINELRRKIMTAAWSAVKKDGISFGEAQKKAWKAIRIQEQMKKKERVEFIYIRQSDNSERFAIGTLKEGFLPKPKNTNQKRRRPKNVITYFDLERQKFRSFKICNIL